MNVSANIKIAMLNLQIFGGGKCPLPGCAPASR